MGAIGHLYADSYRVYFGTYTTQGKIKSEGIYAADFAGTTGELGEPRLVAKTPNPAFLAIHPYMPVLFAVNEIKDFDDSGSGSVTAYRIDDSTGLLTELSRQSTGGGHPCHLSVDPSGDFLFVANYSGGSVASFGINEDGSLTEALSLKQHSGSSVHPKRQAAPHAHSIYSGPSANAVYAVDLGTDQIVRYEVNADGVLETLGSKDLTPGGGPRHLAFHPNGKYLYSINELSNSISLFLIDPETGDLTPVKDFSTLPDAYEDTSSTAEIKIHPSGRYLYGSNRGHDSIVVFEIELESGLLSLVEHQSITGQTPRNFNFDPTGRFLLVAGQRSNSVEVFELDLKSGQLKETGTVIEVLRPTCVIFAK